MESYLYSPYTPLGWETWDNYQFALNDIRPQYVVAGLENTFYFYEKELLNSF